MALKRIESLKDHPDAFISVRQAADYIGATPKHIQRQIDKGALPARKFGGAYRILVPDFQRYVGSTEPTA